MGYSSKLSFTGCYFASVRQVSPCQHSQSLKRTRAKRMGRNNRIVKLMMMTIAMQKHKVRSWNNFSFLRWNLVHRFPLTCASRSSEAYRSAWTSSHHSWHLWQRNQTCQTSCNSWVLSFVSCRCARLPLNKHPGWTIDWTLGPRPRLKDQVQAKINGLNSLVNKLQSAYSDGLVHGFKEQET